MIMWRSDLNSLVYKVYIYVYVVQKELFGSSLISLYESALLKELCYNQW